MTCKERGNHDGHAVPASQRGGGRRVVASFVVLLVLFAASSVPAAETACRNGICQPQSSLRPAVVRVAVSDRSGGRSYGSGTLVFCDENRALVLSCAHVFSDASGVATVSFSDGRLLPATLVEVDSAWDLSALRIESVTAPVVKLADDYPRPGEPLESCGYGPDGRFQCHQGRALGYARTSGTDTYETLQLTGAARDGDSGGPVFNQRGELVAVVWGTDGRTVAGTYCGRIRKFLSRIATLGSRPPPSDAAPNVLVPIERPPSTENGLDSIRRRIESLSTRLDSIDERWDSQRQSLAVRLDKIERIAGVAASLRERIDAGQIPSEQHGTGGLGDVLMALLPQVLTALGWTGPPSVAALLAVRLIVGLIRRKRAARSKVQQTALSSQISQTALNDDYARQLADVFALSGRSTTADATLGREYDEELRRAEESSDGTLAAWAKRLRRNVATRFYRIHGPSPAPAEPVV